MTTISLTAETLEQLAAALRRVTEHSERVLIGTNGQPSAALIPVEDLKLLERLIEEEEDRIDIADADAALAEMERTGEKPKPLDEVLREIGREDLIRKG